VVALGKTDNKNEAVLTFELEPPNLVPYSQANWTLAFQSFSHSLAPSWAAYDPSTNRLRVGFAYSESLQGQAVSIGADFSFASWVFPLPAVSLSFPESTGNNQALEVYPENAYALAKAVDYLSPVVAVLSLLLFATGYFGCKLQSLEGVAVVQLAALLLFALRDMGPSYVGLSNLGFSLGISVLSWRKYSYEDSPMPTHIGTLLPAYDVLASINIAIAVIVAPLLVALVAKILSLTCFRQKPTIERTWKNSFGTFTYYGLLFLAYGEFSCLVLNLKDFQGNLSNGVTIITGAVYTIFLVISVILSHVRPVWYGCFKKKFYKFEVSQYFYAFSSAERLATAAVIILLSPGPLAAGLAAAPLLFEAVFMVVKIPYVLR
jgi:hypothetical protein